MMLGMEEILCELLDDHEQAGEGGLLPPGFRFHPTDEELVTFYLASKVFSSATAFSAAVDIAEVDLNRCEPWELPDVAKMGEREWYLFSLRDRKYPTGLRTNRATGAGYWKATGKDREVYGGGGGGALLGMKKTLVFYKGRAPRGEKTKWVMHEYRLDGDFSCRHTGKEEWVICRIFHKKNPTMLLHPQQNYLFPNNTNSLPPLLEPPPPPTLLESHSHQDNYPTIMQTLNQNPFLNVHTQEDYQSELKALINPLNILQSSDITLKRPFLPNQDFAFKELSNAIAKQCKKEAGVGAFDDQLAHFQLLSGGNAKWGGSNMNPDSPFLFGLGGEMGLIPLSSSSTTTVDHSHVIQSTAVDHDHHHHHANGMTTHPTFKWW